MTKIEGNCLCGKVSYTTTAKEPTMTAVCHCPDCQRQSGGAFSVNVLVPADTITFTGDTRKQYVVNGASGQKVTRNFCGDCGSPLTTQLAAFGDLSAIKAGTLTDSSWVVPTIQIWCDSAQDWGTLDDSIDRAGANPS